jgi:sulfite reductase (NADPH) flavoprotein alpha-component
MQHPERQSEAGSFGAVAAVSTPVLYDQPKGAFAATKELLDNAHGAESLLNAVSLWNVHRQFERQEAFTSGADAVLNVAGNVSENVFVYPLLDNGAAPVQEDGESKYDHLRARVVTLEIRSGAATAVRGALAVGTSAAALVPSQTLPLFLPNLFQIAQSEKTAVFHVACESIRQDLTVGSSYESIYALQHSGALLLNSSNPQECHDLAVVAHVAALRLKKLLVHFYDGSRVARELAKINVLSQASLKQITSVESSTFNSAAAAGLGVAEQVQVVMDDLFHVLQKQYKVYEYTGAVDAEYVIVVIGEASAAIEEAVAYERMIGRKVGVLQVRLLLPWSHALFAAAIPATVQRVAVLENISTGAFAFQRGLLTQNVQVFFHSNHWTGDVAPVVVTGIYGGVFRNSGFTSGMGRSVFHHLSSSTTRRSFVVAKSETLYESALETSTTFPQLDVIYGESFELEGADAYTKQFLFWGFDDEAQRGASLLQSFNTTLELLNKNPSTQVNALVNHSSPGAVRPISTLEVRVSLNGRSAGLQQSIEQADVNIVTKASLLKDYDIVSSVKQGGSILVLTNWRTVDDIEESAAFKNQVAAKSIQLLCVDLAELQTRVEDDEVASVGVQVAFLKASGLYNERVVLALLQSRFASKHHSTLASFVSAVWGDVATITYPVEEWKSLTEDVTVDGEVARVPESLASLQPSKVAHSVANVKVSKRSRAAISHETKTAWKLMFPDAFGARQNSREHVEALVKVTKWERLTPADYDRNVFHVEMDIDNTPIKYAIGEALAVFAHNDEKEVVTFLRAFNVDPEALVTIPVVAKGKHAAADGPTEETLTYFHLFSQVLDVFGRPSKKFYQALLDLATDEKEKETLTLLLDAEGKDEFKRRVDETTTYAELLEEFKSARPTIEHLIQLVPRIKARHYSIASSMKMNPKSVHLLIVVHDWTTPSGKYRVGQATHFLRAVKPGQMLSVHVCSSVMKLPVNPEDPIIMAGLGTGMAPFRAFIQERAFLKAQGIKVGPIALYFGSRSKAQEYLYGEELDRYEREGLVTYLRCAFSRDQPHKVYIQDKISEDKDILADLLLKKNGHFYLCGPTWPVADVREALISSFTSVGGLDRKHANAYIERMREEGRYVLEVY